MSDACVLCGATEARRELTGSDRLYRTTARAFDVVACGGCGLLRLKEGSLYPALYRLEAAGEVKAVWEEDSHGRRGARRRIYHLTAKGKRQLESGRMPVSRG